MVLEFICNNPMMDVFFTVNVGDYIQAVLDRNLAENISRVLYPNDNVSFCSPYLRQIEV